MIPRKMPVKRVFFEGRKRMDTLDRKALAHLMRRGRATWAELGQLLGLSAPATADRVRKLEEKGIIRGYAALPNAEALGYSLVAYVFVTLGSHRKRSAFLRAIEKLEEVSECHHIAGDDDYLLKIRCRGTRDLDRLLARELKDKLAVARTRTTVVLATSKDTIQVPVSESRRVPDAAENHPASET
jgi:Lrp/AsnC family transcriptional regulator, leucine-responsive regulatory protein